MSDTTAHSQHGELLMGLVHHVTARAAGRTTMDLNVRQRLVIQRLGQAGAAPMVEIAQGLGFSPSTMTGLVDRLEEQGYVLRQPHPTDRRAIQLSLTAKGESVFAEEVEFYRLIVDEILAALPAAERPAVLRGIEGLVTGDADAAAA